MIKFNNLDLMVKYVQYTCMRENGVSHTSIKQGSTALYNDNYDVIYNYFKKYYSEN